MTEDKITVKSHRGIPVEILTGPSVRRGCWEQVIVPRLAAARATAIVLQEYARNPSRHEYVLPTPGNVEDPPQALLDLCKSRMRTLLKNSELSYGKELWQYYVDKNGGDADKMMRKHLDEALKNPDAINFEGIIRLLEIGHYMHKFHSKEHKKTYNIFVFYRDGREVEEDDLNFCFEIRTLIKDWLEDRSCQKISIPGQFPRYFIESGVEFFPYGKFPGVQYITRTINRLRARKFGKYQLTVEPVPDPLKHRDKAPPKPVTLWSINPREYRALKKYYAGKIKIPRSQAAGRAD